MESRLALWSWSCVGSLMMFAAAALIELAAAGAPQEGQMQGSAPRSGGGESFLWFLPAALGAVLMLTFFVVLCVSRARDKHSYRGATTTTQPFLCTAVADQQVAAAAEHVYINQPGNQNNREGQAGSSAVPPVQSGRTSPHYASLTSGGGLIQNVYEPSRNMGTREADPDQAQRGYEVPCVSVKQQENGVDETGTTTSLYTNESVQSRDAQLHAYYHIPRQEHAELRGTETDEAGQSQSISPPAVPLPPVPDRPAVTTEDELQVRTQLVQNEPKPTAIHPRKGPLLRLPSWAEASSQSMSKPSPLPSPVSTITGRGGEEKVIKYKEPPSTEHLIHENFRAMKCPIVPSRELRFGEKLGEGYFATVHSAVWSSPHGQFEVAVKKLKSSASAEVRVRFLQEALIMAQFLHPNIVQLCGMTQDTTQGIILELLPNGSLKSYLETLRKHALEYPEGQIASALLLFAQQIASGMNYLANKDFVHRDLAARNILLDGDYVCKLEGKWRLEKKVATFLQAVKLIGDFGLARGIAGESYYKAKSGHIPVKWTAPEALEFNRYTSASDVWSYGVLLFEMWSLGRMPMADKKNAEISTHLNGGYRMSPPPGCSRGIYKLMIKCWHPNPEKRPTFGMVYGAIEVKGLALLAMDSAAIRSSTVHTNAHVIGAPLAAGEGLYRDLQVAYR